MLKLTKAQRKDRDLIEAWVNNAPFRENSRSKQDRISSNSPANFGSQR